MVEESPLVSNRSASLFRVLSYALPIALPLLLCGIYILAPEFYLRYILEITQREYQAVELITFSCALSAAVILFTVGLRAWKRTKRHAATPEFGLNVDRHKLAGRRGVMLILFIAAATLFLAGEEVSWGQTYFGWESEVRETNLHNTVPISFGGLGSMGIVTLLIALPTAWRFRSRFPFLTEDLRPAIPEGPVITAVVTGFVVDAVKSIAKATLDTDTNIIYIEYFEQLKEQKEMLIAVALFLYALHRPGAVRRWLAQHEPGENDG